MEVRALTEIKSGDEISTRYYTPWVGQPERQQTIQNIWKFVCNCLRCQDPTDLKTNFSAIRCQTCKERSLPNISNESVKTNILQTDRKPAFS